MEMKSYATDRSVLSKRYAPLDMIFVVTSRRILIAVQSKLPAHIEKSLATPIVADTTQPIIPLPKIEIT